MCNSIQNRNGEINMMIFIIIAIGILMFKLGVLTVIVAALTLAGQVVGFIISVIVIGFLLKKFMGGKP
jgi:hypothetical protein